MTTQTISEYLLIFRGTDWHRGLSPEQIQQVVNHMKSWFDRLTEQGKLKAGQPLMREGKIVSQKKGQRVADGLFAESNEAIADRGQSSRPGGRPCGCRGHSASRQAECLLPALRRAGRVRSAAQPAPGCRRLLPRSTAANWDHIGAGLPVETNPGVRRENGRPTRLMSVAIWSYSSNAWAAYVLDRTGERP